MYQAQQQTFPVQFPAGASVPSASAVIAQRMRIAEQRRVAYERALREGLVTPIEASI